MEQTTILMNNENIISILKEAGIKPTSNRILVLRTVTTVERPLSLKELEYELRTLEKSSIFRVLSLFVKHHVLHTIEDGNGIVRYEICNAKNTCHDDDIHAHFFCEICHKVYCLNSIHMPHVDLPNGFTLHSMNYMFKGICPDCQKQNNNIRISHATL